MVDNLVYVISLRHISVERTADKINALIADCVWYPQIAIHYFVDTIERVFLVDDCVQENS